MIVKKIMLMENETVMEALASLGEMIKCSDIFIDTSCKYKIRNRSFEEVANKNYLKLKFSMDNPLFRTEIAMFKIDGQNWYDVDAIYSRELIYVRPETAENVIYITSSTEKTNSYKRFTLQENENPIDFILSLKEKAKQNTFILPEYIVFRIIVDNKDKKTIISKKDSIQISWDNGDLCLLQKQKNTNDYVLLGLCIGGFKLNKINGDFAYLV